MTDEREQNAQEQTAQDDVAKLQAERDDLLARLQRLSADFANYQKRAQRDIEQAREFANETLIRSLLPVLDDMERALDAAHKTGRADDPLMRGMDLVYDKAQQMLKQFGVTVIDAQGKPFDPTLHQAIMQQPSEDHPPHTVLQVAQKGYQLKGRTIRPAAVVVSNEAQ